MINEDLEKYCPTGTPILIPYMEVYRTDELNYEDYVSPLNEADGSAKSTSGESNLEEGDAENSDGTSPSNSSNNSSNNSSSASSNSKKTKEKQLYTKLSVAVQKFFKSSVNVNTLVNRYRKCSSNKTCINNVTKKSKVWLKKGNDVTTVSLAIYMIIKNHNG